MADLTSFLHSDKTITTAQVIKVRKNSILVRFNNIDVYAKNSTNRNLRQGDSVLLSKTGGTYFITGQIEGQTINRIQMEVLIDG